MNSRGQTGVNEERISALRTPHPPGLVQEPSEGADDQKKKKIKGVEAAGTARVGYEFDYPPYCEKPGANHQAKPDLPDLAAFRCRCLCVEGCHGSDSDAARVGRPDMLVHLELHPHCQAIGQDPSREHRRL